MPGEAITVTVPVWGLLASIGGFIATAITVIVGVLVSNRDLRGAITGLNSATRRLSKELDELEQAVGRLSGLPTLVDRETSRADQVHNALFRRIERIEQRIFASEPAR